MAATAVERLVEDVTGQERVVVVNGLRIDGAGALVAAGRTAEYGAAAEIDPEHIGKRRAARDPENLVCVVAAGIERVMKLENRIVR